MTKKLMLVALTTVLSTSMAFAGVGTTAVTGKGPKADTTKKGAVAQEAKASAGSKESQNKSLDAAGSAMAKLAAAKKSQTTKSKLLGSSSAATLSAIIDRNTNKCLDGGCRADVGTLGVIAKGEGTANDLSVDQRKKGTAALRTIDAKAILTQADVVAAMEKEGINVKEARVACKPL